MQIQPLEYRSRPALFTRGVVVAQLNLNNFTSHFNMFLLIASVNFIILDMKFTYYSFRALW